MTEHAHISRAVQLGKTFFAGEAFKTSEAPRGGPRNQQAAFLGRSIIGLIPANIPEPLSDTPHSDNPKIDKILWWGMNQESDCSVLTLRCPAPKGYESLLLSISPSERSRTECCAILAGFHTEGSILGASYVQVFLKGFADEFEIVPDGMRADLIKSILQTGMSISDEESFEAIERLVRAGPLQSMGTIGSGEETMTLLGLGS